MMILKQILGEDYIEKIAEDLTILNHIKNK
jgi:hypothetical protein